MSQLKAAFVFVDILISASVLARKKKQKISQALHSRARFVFLYMARENINNS